MRRNDEPRRLLILSIKKNSIALVGFVFFFFGQASLSAASLNQDAALISKIDSLYFHRDQGENLARSLKLINSGLEKNPNDAALLWRKGRDLERMGENQEKSKDKIRFFEKARKILEDSIKIDSQSPDAHYWLGVTLGRIGQTRGILRSLFLLEPLRRQMREALILDPHYEPAIHVLGEIYREIPRFVGGSIPKAIAHFKQARQMNPHDLVNLLSLGQAYQDAGENAEALKVLNYALTVKNPADPGEAAENRKDIQKVIQEIKSGT